MQHEVLVIRSSISSRLYDVVKVDFFNETVEFLEKGLEFEDAVTFKENVTEVM